MAPSSYLGKETKTMRDRFKDTISRYAETYSSYQYSAVGGTCTTPPSALPDLVKKSLGTTATLLVNEGMSDVVTPNFKKLSAEGKIINNPMSKFKDSLVSEVFSYNFEYGVESYLACNPAKWVHMRDYRYAKAKGVSDLFPFISLSFSDDEIQTEIDKSVSKAFSRIGNDEVLMLGMMKEFGSTVAGLAYILKKVYRIYRYTKRAELKKLRKELSFSELQEIYMNARYNLRPLAYDAAGMVRVLQAETKPSRQTFRASSVIRKEESSQDSFTEISNTLFSVNGTVKRTSFLEVITRAGVLTHAEPATQAQLLGLDSIIETAWDILPFSFIIDWFINVGDTICAWTPKMGFKTLASWITIDSLLIQSTVLGGFNVAEKSVNGQRLKNPRFETSGTSATRIYRTFERRVNPAIPIIPSFDVNLDPLKILDLAIISKRLFKLKNFRNLRV